MKGTNTQSTDRVRILVYSAICLALAFVLSNVTIFRMPQGGSVTLASMLFIALIGYWFGIRAGLVAGITFGFLRWSNASFVLTPVQAILDYVVAYAALGFLSGVFSGRRFGSYGLYLGYLAGVTGTFFAQVASGIIFFYMYAPEGQHVFVYSAIYNLSHILPEVVITFAILALPNLKHAIEAAAPKGCISVDNAFSRAVQNKDIMRRLPYAVVSMALFISFFIFPLVHRADRIRVNASGFELAIGSGYLFEEVSLAGYPVVAVLLIAPVTMFFLTLMNKPIKVLNRCAIAGLLVWLGFIGAVFVTLRASEYSGIYALTMSNWIILAIFIGLIFALRTENKVSA